MANSLFSARILRTHFARFSSFHGKMSGTFLSYFMRWLRRYRKLHYPHHKFALEYMSRCMVSLCLDVGCGENPFPYADVLCDLRRIEKCEQMFVISDAHFLPFRSEIFDFVVCFHVFEHVKNPKLVFAELKRIAKHGHIQTPSPFAEMLYAYDIHRWFIGSKKKHLYYQASHGLPISCLFRWLRDKLILWQAVDFFLSQGLGVLSTNYYW